jgi:hypothetical protein
MARVTRWAGTRVRLLVDAVAEYAIILLGPGGVVGT